MNVLKIFAAAALMAGAAMADNRGAPPPRPVTVCINPGRNATAAFLAQAAASRMLAKVGVKLEWHSDPASCPAHGPGIEIRLMENTPPYERPGAMAYAMPFQGTRIVVFYDRVQAAAVPALLAHVLVHEITHLLQGVERHAPSGIMKARWDARDYARMRHEPLGFTEEDVLLIRHGLDVRAGLK